MWKRVGADRNVVGEFSSSYGSSFGEISMFLGAAVAHFPLLPDQKLPVILNFQLFPANVS